MSPGNPERLQHVDNPREIEGALGVQPIICDTQLNVPFFQPRRVIDPSGKPVSRARYLKGYVEDSQRRIYKYMVEHHLYCAVAHLGYVAEAYGGLAVLCRTNTAGAYPNTPGPSRNNSCGIQHCSTGRRSSPHCAPAWRPAASSCGATARRGPHSCQKPSTR